MKLFLSSGGQGRVQQPHGLQPQRRGVPQTAGGTLHAAAVSGQVNSSCFNPSSLMLVAITIFGPCFCLSTRTLTGCPRSSRTPSKRHLWCCHFSSVWISTTSPVLAPMAYFCHTHPMHAEPWDQKWCPL